MLKFASKEICIGCTACWSVCPRQCIEMKPDMDGFAYPHIKDVSACINCKKCEMICPVLNIKKQDCLPMAYAAFSKNKCLRMESSSGGIFSELSEEIISQGGAVYGAAYDEQFEVHHWCVDNTEDLRRLRGAKYSESHLGNTFSDILERLKQGQLVLFSGTPCQVAGLKSFVRKDFNNLFCVDFVCHGVPSPMAWQSYIKYRTEEDANGELPCNINLRSKVTGWSKYQYSNVFEYENGKQHRATSSQSLFMKLFVGDYISRPSCENCKFKGYNRCSDITLGDFWGIWDIEPEMDDNKGTSVVLVHSDKGRALWKDINSKVKCKEVSLEQASQQNLSMLRASRANKNRALVLQKIREGKIDQCEEFMVAPKASILTKIKGKAKRLFDK